MGEAEAEVGDMGGGVTTEPMTEANKECAERPPSDMEETDTAAEDKPPAFTIVWDEKRKLRFVLSNSQLARLRACQHSIPLEPDYCFSTYIPTPCVLM